MKLILSLLALLFTNLAFAQRQKCVDLSHKSPLGRGSIEWHQVGCEKFHAILLDPDGNAYGESDTVFSDDFNELKIDDEYEKLTNRQRWMWSRDGKTLIHEATIDKLDKSTLDKSFVTFTELITLTSEGKIRTAKTEIIRLEKADGTITVEVENETQSFERL